MGITWSFKPDQSELGILQINLLSKESYDGWHLQEKIIQRLKDAYNGLVLSIFDEAISLIPRDHF